MQLELWTLTKSEATAAPAGFSFLIGKPRRDPKIFGIDIRNPPLASVNLETAQALIDLASEREDLLCDRVAIRRRLVARGSRWAFGRNLAGHDGRWPFALYRLSRPPAPPQEEITPREQYGIDLPRQREPFRGRGLAAIRGNLLTLEIAALLADYLDRRDESDGVHPQLDGKGLHYVVSTGPAVERSRRRAGRIFDRTPAPLDGIETAIWEDDVLVITTLEALSYWEATPVVAPAARKSRAAEKSRR